MADLKTIMNKMYYKPEVNPEYYLDTGYKPLNKVISGRYGRGMQNGRIVELSGWESSGKTAIATQLMRATQQQGGVAIFEDFERSFDWTLAERQGLSVDQESCNFIYRKPTTAEDGVDEFIQLVKMIRESGLEKEKPILGVFDSIPCMVPRALTSKDSVENNMKDNLAIPMMLNAALPRLIQAADDYNVTILMINQLRDNIGVMYGPAEKTPGGKAKDFAFSLRIKCRRKIIEEKGKKLGQLITAEAIKNKQSAPFGVCEWFFQFNSDGTGSFDVIGSTIDYCITNKIGGIEQAGAWFNFDGEKYQGKEKLKAALLEKPEMFGKLEQALLDEDNKVG